MEQNNKIPPAAANPASITVLPPRVNGPGQPSQPPLCAPRQDYRKAILRNTALQIASG